MRKPSIRDILYEPPGPRAQRRIRITTAAALLLIAGLVFLIIRQFAETGQLNARYWAFFGRGTTWRFLGEGLLSTVEAAVTGALISFAAGFVLMRGRLNRFPVIRFLSAAVIEFENGSIGYHGATWGARGTRLGYDFQIQTEKGMLEYDHFTGMVRHYHAAAAHVPGGIEHGRYDILWERGKNESAGKLTHIEIEHFAECVRTGKTPVTDGRAALQGLRVIWAMYDAERHNTMADLRGMGLPESSYRKI